MSQEKKLNLVRVAELLRLPSTRYESLVAFRRAERAKDQDKLGLTIPALRIWHIAKVQKHQKLVPELWRLARAAAVDDWGAGTEILETDDAVEIENLNGMVAAIPFSFLADKNAPPFNFGDQNEDQPA